MRYIIEEAGWKTYKNSKLDCIVILLLQLREGELLKCPIALSSNKLLLSG